VAVVQDIYKNIYIFIYVLVVIDVCICLCENHFPALRGMPLITVGERERTHALHGEVLYPTTPSATPDPSVEVSVGEPQVTPLSECLLLPSLFIYHIYICVFTLKA